MKPEILIREAAARGMFLEVAPDRKTLWVWPEENLDAQFARTLKANKKTLLWYLRGRQHLLAQIFAGEFDDANLQTRLRAMASLREHWPGPWVQAALRILKANRQPHAR